MPESFKNITYPRRRLIRVVLRQLIRAIFSSIAEFVTIGTENLPKSGPLLVIGNHFSFLDPVAVIGTVPYPIEYLGGTQMPNAPGAVSWIARLYGVLPVFRGSVSREALNASKTVLNQQGVLGIFPEAGSWATVLRPARPGAAYLASCTQTKILPIGLDGLVNVFPFLRRGKRALVTVRIGKAFGPFYVSDRGENDKEKLTEIGDLMMRQIAELIPNQSRGRYSDDADLRAHAEKVSAYPWEGKPER